MRTVHGVALLLFLPWSVPTVVAFPSIDRVLDLDQEIRDAYPDIKFGDTRAFHVNREGDVIGSALAAFYKPFFYSGTTQTAHYLPCKGDGDFDCNAIFLTDRLKGRPDEVLAVGVDSEVNYYAVMWHLNAETGKVLGIRRIKPPKSLGTFKPLYAADVNRLGQVLLDARDESGVAGKSIVYNFFSEDFKLLNIPSSYGALSMNNRGDVVGTNKLGIYRGNNKWHVVTVPPPTPTDTIRLTSINNKRVIVSEVNVYPTGSTGRYLANADGTGSWGPDYGIGAFADAYAQHLSLRGDFIVGAKIFSAQDGKLLSVPEDFQLSTCLRFYGGSIPAQFYVSDLNNAQTLAGAETYRRALLLLPKSTKACAANCVDNITCSCRKFLENGSSCWMRQATDSTRCYTPEGVKKAKRHLKQVENQFKLKCLKEGLREGWYP